MTSGPSLRTCKLFCDKEISLRSWTSKIFIRSLSNLFFFSTLQLNLQILTVWRFFYQKTYTLSFCITLPPLNCRNLLLSTSPIWIEGTANWPNIKTVILFTFYFPRAIKINFARLLAINVCIRSARDSGRVRLWIFKEKNDWYALGAHARVCIYVYARTAPRCVNSNFSLPCTLYRSMRLNNSRTDVYDVAETNYARCAGIFSSAIIATCLG